MSYSALDKHLHYILSGYLPGLERDTIRKIHRAFADDGYRKILKATDPDIAWRKKAKESNNRIIAKYSAMEGIKVET